MTDDSATSAWIHALDILERDLAETNALLDAAPDNEIAELALRRASQWRVPHGIGPLPRALAGRATAVLEAQKATASRLARAMAATRRQVEVIDASDPLERERPVYLDTEG